MKMTSPDRRIGGPDRRVIYHDSSLSAFATGILIGTLVTIVLATKEGREKGKQLLEAIKDTSKELAPELEKLPEKIEQITHTNFFDQLHRNPPVSNSSSFTRSGAPLK